MTNQWAKWSNPMQIDENGETYHPIDRIPCHGFSGANKILPGPPQQGRFLKSTCSAAFLRFFCFPASLAVIGIGECQPGLLIVPDHL